MTLDETTTAAIIDRLIEREGDFVNHPNDRGQATNFGITLDTLSRWLGRPATVDEVCDLTREEAARIYRSEYLRAPKIDHIEDSFLQAHVLDCAVLHGPRTAIRWLQEATGEDIAIDGWIGPETLGAVGRCDPGEVSNRIAARRIRYMGDIVASDETQLAFIRGWLNRATKWLEAA